MDIFNTKGIPSIFFKKKEKIMDVNQLIDYLISLKEKGYGEYIVIDDGYLNEIVEDDITVDEKQKQVIL